MSVNKMYDVHFICIYDLPFLACFFYCKFYIILKTPINNYNKILCQPKSILFDLAKHDR